MRTTEHDLSYGTYWSTWLLLLVFTLVMIAVDSSSLSRPLLVPVLVGVMLAKAALIGANFMHLRIEKPGLSVAVATGILATAAVLFFLIAFDGLRILELSAR